MIFQCDVQKILETEKKSLTVGERFHLVCRSSGDVEDSQLNQKVFAPQLSDSLKLRILDHRHLPDGTYEILATSVLVGRHTIADLRIGNHPVDPFQINVVSVQDPKKPQTEPLGPILPSQVVLSKNFFIGGLLLTLALLFWVFLSYFVRYREQKRKQQFLASLKTDLAPLDELALSLRSLLVNLNSSSDMTIPPDPEWLLKLDQIYWAFLGRILNLPLPYYSQRKKKKYLDMLKKRGKAWREWVQWYEEFEHLKGQSSRQKMEELISWLKDLGPKVLLESRNDQ